MDFAPSRAVSMVRAAREVAAGRAELSDPASDRRLLAIPGIGPWTVALVGLAGTFVLREYHKLVASAPPLRIAA